MQYKVVWFAMADAEAGLNALAADGWCLHFAWEECDLNGTGGLRCVLEQKVEKEKPTKAE
jgi:hypothetical protein